VREERDGGYAFHQLDEDGGRLWPTVAEELRRAGDSEGDLARLAEVLRRRTDRGGGRPLLEPGRSWPAWARALGYLIPPLEVADLCCGDGALTAEMARWAKRVVAVDRDPKRLQAARRRMAREGFRHIDFKCEDVERLTVPDASVEMVVLSQALHQFEDTDVPLGQARRILKPGGRLLLMDLAPHGEEWVREKLGHAHLGFPAEELAARVKGAGFAGVRVEELRKGPAEPFRILVLTALKGGGGKQAGTTGSKRKRR
jgi:ArsR family transcriptional regulator